MAGEGQSYQNRIADLLDDITVGARAPTRNAASFWVENGAATPLPAVRTTVASPAASHWLPPAPPSHRRILPVSRQTPPENRIHRHRQKMMPGSLPPFLRQPPGRSETGSTLPGHGLVRVCCQGKHAACRAAICPAAGPATGTATRLNRCSNRRCPPLPAGAAEGAPHRLAAQADAPAADRCRCAALPNYGRRHGCRQPLLPVQAAPCGACHTSRPSDQHQGPL